MNSDIAAGAQKIKNESASIFLEKFKKICKENKDFSNEEIIRVLVKNDFDEEKTAKEYLKLALEYIKNEAFI